MNPTSREKIFLYAGGFIILLAGIYLILIKPTYKKHSEIITKIEQKKLLLQRYKAILEQEDQLKERVQYIKREFNKLDKVLLAGAKPSLAASALQEMLEKITKKSDVTIKNVKNLKPLKKGAFYQVPIELGFESTLRELRDIIYHIENSTIFLFVRSLNIKLAKLGNPEKLGVVLIVDGFAKSNSNT